MNNSRLSCKTATTNNISYVDDYQNSNFCSMPIEIINKVCEYLDLVSILNITKTCKSLRYYIIGQPELRKLKRRYQLIYSHNNFLCSNRNISCENINQLFFRQINNFTIAPNILNEAILDTRASKNYGYQFALASIMSQGAYSFAVANKIDAVDLPYFKADNDIALSFKAINYHNEYLVVAKDQLYTAKLYEDKKNDIKFIGNIVSLVADNFVNSIKKIFFQDEFIIIKLSDFDNNSIILKKDQDTYISLTSKSINATYNETLVIFKDEFNLPYFIICINNKVYKFTEQQLLALKANSNNHGVYGEDITPNNLLVSEIATSDNGNMILFYGKNATNQTQEELQVQIDGKIIDTIGIPNYSKECKFVCSPKGTSFAINNIFINENFWLDAFVNAVLYKVVNNKLQKYFVEAFAYDPPELERIVASYKTDNLVQFSVNRQHCLVFVQLTEYDTSRTAHLSLNSRRSYDTRCMSFNSSGTMYAIFERNFMNEGFTNQIKLYCIKEKQIYYTGLINCRQRVGLIVFSPNSQLIVTKEIQDTNTNIFNTLRVYRILRRNQGGELSFVVEAEFIAEFVIDKNITDVKFHDSGFKLIINTKDSIRVLAIKSVSK